MIANYDGPRDGTKKDVSGEMPATYQPLYVEAAWQEYWEASGFYSCEPSKALVSRACFRCTPNCVVYATMTPRVLGSSVSSTFLYTFK